jgi:hypothetical protein
MSYEGNIGLVATGISNQDGATQMYLWRMRDYTYEIQARGSISDQYKEVFNETPFKVALKKFEKKVGEVKLW